MALIAAIQSLNGIILPVLFIWTIFSPIAALALEQSDYIDTNRPSFCQSSLVVPQGSLQLENGSLYQQFQHGLTYADVPETEVRVGFTRKTEFQMFVPNVVFLNQDSKTNIGASDLGEVGFKEQLINAKRFIASFVTGVNIPTGSKLVSGTGIQPVIRLPYLIPITKNWSICGMQSLVVINSGRSAQWQPFVMATRSFGDKPSVFIEYAGFFTHNAQPVNIIHFGGAYKLNHNHQVDMHFGFGMNKAAPAALVGFGYSYRFDRLPWSSETK